MTTQAEICALGLEWEGRFNFTLSGDNCLVGSVSSFLINSINLLAKTKLLFEIFLGFVNKSHKAGLGLFKYTKYNVK